MTFRYRFGELKRLGKSLTTKVVGLDDTFNLDTWKAQFGSRSKEI
jgi:hypothetical protein